MKREFIHSTVVALYSLIVLTAILLFSILFYLHSFLAIYVIAVVGILLTVNLAVLPFKNAIAKGIKSFVLIFSITYFLTEVSTYVLLSLGLLRPDIAFFYKGITATDKPYAVYDSTSGFRGIPGRFRYLGIENGHLEMDHFREINAQGWFSNRNYTYKKSNPKTRRYMVLGDSYSSGIATSTPWPDLIQQKLIQNGNDTVELYNFSLEGTGLANWYHIFFRELVPRYDFDGVIIASSSERSAYPDLDRKFFMAHSFNDATYIQMADVLKQKPPAVFPASIGVPIMPIYPAPELERIKRNYIRREAAGIYFSPKKPDLWFLSMLYGFTDGFRNQTILTENACAYNQPYESYYGLVDQPYKMEYFDRRFKYGFMLKEIIAYCKKENKEVLLACIPDYENAKEYVNKKNVMCLKELQFLTKYYDLKMFNGFEIFEGRDESFVDRVFYEYDRHWNKQGAELFSEKFYNSSLLNARRD